MEEWKYNDWMGWWDQGDGKLFYGQHVDNGRVKDEGNFRLKSALRTLVDGGYRILRTHPIDQFLWSPHVEAVALLEKPRKRR